MGAVDWLDHGALGAAMLVLLLAVTVLFKTLLFVRELVDVILQRVQANTRALTMLSARLDGQAPTDDLMRGLFHLRPRNGGVSGREES